MQGKNCNMKGLENMYLKHIMKKGTIIFMVLYSILICSTVFAEKNNGIILSSKEVIKIKGENWIALRALKNLGAYQLEWHGKNVIVISDNNILDLSIKTSDCTYLGIKGNAVFFPGKPQIKKGITYVPVPFLKEYFNLNLTKDNNGMMLSKIEKVNEDYNLEELYLFRKDKVDLNNDSLNDEVSFYGKGHQESEWFTMPIYVERKIENSSSILKLDFYPIDYHTDRIAVSYADLNRDGIKEIIYSDNTPTPEYYISKPRILISDKKNKIKKFEINLNVYIENIRQYERIEWCIKTINGKDYLEISSDSKRDLYYLKGYCLEKLK